MAACNFGALSIKSPSLNFVSSGSKLGTLQLVNGISYGRAGKSKALICKYLSKSETVVKLENSSEETKSSATSQPVLNSLEVQTLLNRICDTTSVAEFELKLGGFRLYVSRNLAGKTEPSPLAPPPASAPVTVNTSPVQNGSASSPSLAITKAATSSVGIESFIDTAADEGLMILQSPKVGFFRRSRSIKGKRAPPPCKEKQIVKEGQVLCYIEQLGGEVPIESDVSGEVIKILRKDGDPVGYGDALIAVLPSFPGIKKLQ